MKRNMNVVLNGVCIKVCDADIETNEEQNSRDRQNGKHEFAVLNESSFEVAHY